MKKLNGLLMTLVSLVGGMAQYGQAQNLGVTGAECELRSAWGLEADVCLLKADRLGHGTSVALHYGSLGTKKLVVEVLRAKVTPAKLQELNQKISVAIQATSDGMTEARMQTLSGTVNEGALHFAMEDRGLSSYYIASVVVKPVSLQGSLEEMVKSVFGQSAIAIIYGVHRGEVD